MHLFLLNMTIENFKIITQQKFPNIDLSEFGRFIKFCYHRNGDNPNHDKILYAIVTKVYAHYIQAICLNWRENNEPFERFFYTDHFVSEIAEYSTGKVFAPRAFYEIYVSLYHPERKFGNTLAGKENSQPQICFTGFAAKRKSELKQLAKNADLWVTDEVRKHLEYLVCGSNAGPKKIEKAKELGAVIWTEADFLEWLANP